MNYPSEPTTYKADQKYSQEQEMMDKPARSQSKVDDALMQCLEGIEGLEQLLTNLEDRLKPVMNDYPRKGMDEAMKDPEKPTGDSALLSHIFVLSSKQSLQANRIRTIMNRLDI